MQSIKIRVELKRSRVEALLERQGYKIAEHDFGRWESEYHNHLIWRENVLKGIKINGEWLTVEAAFDRIYGQTIGDHFMNILENTEL